MKNNLEQLELQRAEQYAEMTRTQAVFVSTTCDWFRSYLVEVMAKQDYAYRQTKKEIQRLYTTTEAFDSTQLQTY